MDSAYFHRPMLYHRKHRRHHIESNSSWWSSNDESEELEESFKSVEKKIEKQGKSEKAAKNEIPSNLARGSMENINSEDLIREFKNLFWT